MTNPESSGMSERELEILRLVATGASNKEIAQRLYISSNTVKVHLRNIFGKIGVVSRTEAAMHAVRIGLVQPVPGRIIEEAERADEPSGLGNITTTQPPAPTGLSSRQRILLWGLLLVTLLAGAIIITLVIRSAVAPQAAPPPAPTPTAIPRWQELNAMPTARSGLAVAALENQLYAIGGQTGAGIVNVVERFDPATNTWQTLAPKPQAVTDIQAAVIGGEIFVPGGRTSSGKATNILEVYDPRLNAWEQRSPMPLALSGYALVAFEGQLYLFGGWDGQTYHAVVFSYDPDLDTWQERTPMPTARAFSGAAISSGVIYVIGGYNGSEALDVNEAYSPARDAAGDEPWQPSPPLPDARYAMGVSAVADLIYVIGGKSSPAVTHPPLEYIPATQTWQTFYVPIPETWSDLGIAPLGQHFYLLGGLVEDTPTSLHLSYQAIFTIVIPFVP